MKNNLKSQTLQKFIEILEQKYPEIEEYKRRAIAHDLNEHSFAVFQEAIEFFSNSQNEKVLELEQHRKIFHDYINMLEKSVKILFDSFRKQGFIKPDIDKKTNKPILKGRTTMVDEMVDFLNKLNIIVLDFYKDVYRIESRDEGKEFGVEQISLFN
jgi:hypothetical protein